DRRQGPGRDAERSHARAVRQRPARITGIRNRGRQPRRPRRLRPPGPRVRHHRVRRLRGKTRRRVARPEGRGGEPKVLRPGRRGEDGRRAARLGLRPPEQKAGRLLGKTRGKERKPPHATRAGRGRGRNGRAGRERLTRTAGVRKAERTTARAESGAGRRAGFVRAYAANGSSLIVKKI